MNWVMIVAGGSGQRMKAQINKVFLKVNRQPILYWTIKIFQDNPIIDKILIVGKKEEFGKIRRIIKKNFFSKVDCLVVSGETRQETVLNGLNFLKNKANENDVVGVHNAANPFVSDGEIKDVFEVAKKYKAAVLAYPSKDTIKIVNENNLIIQTPVRKYCWCAQTPQVGYFKDLYKAYTDAFEKNITATDECQLLENMGIKPKIVECSDLNFKITTPADLVLVKQILKINFKK